MLRDGSPISDLGGAYQLSIFSECRVRPSVIVSGTRELGWRAVTGSQRRALVGVPVFFLPSVGRCVSLGLLYHPGVDEFEGGNKSLGR